MEFNQLESFLSVVKHGSFSKAAKELYLTQPTVSNNIQNLEKELGTTLINRISRTISLTDSGKSFYKYAVELINLREKAKFDIKEQSNKIGGKLEILTSSIPGQYVLPYIIKDFIKLFPNVSFLINQKNSKEIVDDILDGRENFGIVGAKFPSNALKYIDFYEDEIVLATPNIDRYSMPPNEPLNLKSLLSENFLFRKETSGTRVFIEKCLSGKDLSLNDLNMVFLLGSNEMIKKMIELDLGISFISQISIKNEVDLGLIKAFNVKDLNLNRKFYFVYSSHRSLPPNVEAFKNFIEKWTGIK